MTGLELPPAPFLLLNLVVALLDVTLSTGLFAAALASLALDIYRQSAF
ncbi:MAG: hypothetical protein QMD17_02035 [Rhodocyclaceae bacterium]|nr:hypothetical protein [Rhodocyclaceae bacterium]